MQYLLDFSPVKTYEFSHLTSLTKNHLLCFKNENSNPSFSIGLAKPPLVISINHFPRTQITCSTIQSREDYISIYKSEMITDQTASVWVSEFHAASPSSTSSFLRHRWFKEEKTATTRLGFVGWKLETRIYEGKWEGSNWIRCNQLCTICSWFVQQVHWIFGSHAQMLSTGPILELNPQLTGPFIRASSSSLQGCVMPLRIRRHHCKSNLKENNIIIPILDFSIYLFIYFYLHNN